MKTLSVFNNPFSTTPFATHTSILSKTVRGWVEEVGYSEGIIEGRPFVCAVDGRPTLRKDWDLPLHDNAFVSLHPVVEDPVEIIIGIIVVIVSVVVSVALSSAQKSIPDTASASSTTSPDPVYTLRGQQNQNKLGNPVERIYGQVRQWPSYAAAPYTRNINNDQYLYQLFCLGHGKVRIDQIYIEDTPIEQFQGVQYEIIQPGHLVTMFPDNVATSAQVAGTELFGSNEASYTGWTGNYVVCPPVQRTELIEVDLSLTGGLYYSNDAGGMDTRTVEVTIQTRPVDDADTALADWSTVYVFTKTLATNIPQRFTIPITVPLGRYEVRCARTNLKDTSYRAADSISWMALRAFMQSTHLYPGMTMMAVVAKASNNLNDNASSRFNFRGTAMLPVWSPVTGWTPDVPTRSPVWAFCDVFLSTYGGNLTDDFLDLPSLYALDQLLAAKGVFFDWIFQQATTTWETAKAIGLVARSTPMLSGSKITLIREDPQVLPKAVFNENNIAENSLVIELALRGVADHDSLEISYTDPVTWQQKTVLCMADGDAGDLPKQVDAPGCTDRTRAYHIGMYMRLSELWINSNITFSTGMEGLMVTYGDLIAISHKFPKWGQGGYVNSILGRIVSLSDTVTFIPGQTHYILMRRKDGTVYGPSIVTQVSDTSVMLASSEAPSDYFLDLSEPPIYLFGAGVYWGKLARVVDIQPQGDELVTIKATNYNPVIYTADGVVPPAADTGFILPLPPGTPDVSDLQVRAHPTDIYKVVVTWKSLQDVDTFVVLVSTDNVNFNVVAQTAVPYYVLSVLPGHLWIQVYAVSTGAGATISWDGAVGAAFTPPADVAGLALVDWSGLRLTASWAALTGSMDGYIVRVFMRQVGDTYTLQRTVRVASPAFAYALSDAQADGVVGRQAKLIVTGINIAGESPDPTVLEVSNAVPSAATGLFCSTLDLVGTRSFSWTPPTDADIETYRVIQYNVSGQTTGDIIYEGPNNSCVAVVPSSLGSTHYWKVLTKDVWGPEFTPSSEASFF